MSITIPVVLLVVIAVDDGADSVGSITEVVTVVTVEVGVVVEVKDCSALRIVLR